MPATFLLNSVTTTRDPIVDELTYCSYREQRRLFPTIEPERWALLYGSSVASYEDRYQNERGNREECQIHRTH